MSYRFKLQLTRVECKNEALFEWGKDEMYLFGFGVTRKGELFSVGYHSLGSYHTDDVSKPPAAPHLIFESELPEDGLEVLLYLWLIEEDGGGVRAEAASLDAQFRASYLQQAASLLDARFPRSCIPFTAFYKAALPFEDLLQEAATDGRNDEVFLPADLIFHYEPGDATGFNTGGERSFSRSKRLGLYDVYLNYSYRKVPVVFA